jgi:perosamine synthetase
MGIIDNVVLQKTERYATVSRFVLTIEVENRDRIMLSLKEKNIESKPYFPSIHLQPYMIARGYRSRTCPISEYISSRILAIPFFTDINKAEIKYVCENLKDAMLNA